MRAGRPVDSLVKTHVSRLMALVLISLLMTTAGLAQEAARYKELPNFHKVNDHLYRGGQPRTGGLKKLSEFGIKTIVNLRGEDDLTRAEEKEAREAGLTYFNVSMPGLSRPTNEQLNRVLGIINDEQNWPVFVHCKRGSDRTGTIVAIYRITNESWTAAQAIEEAKRHGMSWVQFSMKDYVSDYYRDHNADRQKPSVKADAQPTKQN